VKKEREGDYSEREKKKKTPGKRKGGCPPFLLTKV